MNLSPGRVPWPGLRVGSRVAPRPPPPIESVWWTAVSKRQFESDVCCSDTESGIVDPAVEPHPGQAAKDGTYQAGQSDHDQGDDAGSAQGARVDRDPGEAVQLSQDVVLAAAHRARN